MSGKKPAPKKIVLLDAHAILHRGYHALPDFVSPGGEPTGALYGFTNLLLRLIKEMNPDYIFACFDLPGPTFRHDTYKEYKAGRAKTDEALVAQLIRAHELADALGLVEYSKPGFEADDMLGTIVEQLQPALKKGEVQVIIASGDMDTLQLVDDDRVLVYTLKKGINDTILYNEAKVKERFGFGPELLPDYKGLRGDPSDNIIGIAGIGEKTATDLIVNFGSIENIYKTLKKSPEKLKEAGIKDRIVELLKNGEEEALFSKTLASIRRDAPIEFVLPEKSWRELFDAPKAAAFAKELGFKSLISRLEELGEKSSEFRVQSSEESSPDFDTKSDLFKKVALAYSVIDPSEPAPTPAHIFDLTKAKTLEEAFTFLLKRIENDGLARVWEEIELPLVPVLGKMERQGIMVDRHHLEKLSKEYHIELVRLEKKIWEHAGHEFTINSPKQLGAVLFDELGLTAKGLRKTAGGARSTKVSELEKLVGTHPIVDEIMQYREYQKLLSTYIDTLGALADPAGRIHTTFVQIGAATGRMASIDPNLQNIPIKTELGKNIRKAFVASPGYLLLTADYSQIDLRSAALLSGDRKLVGAFSRGEDIHTTVAMEVFGVGAEEVTVDMRRRAKVLNFGILYGMGVMALKQNLGVSKDEAEKYHDAYFERFSDLKAYIDMVASEAGRTGYTTTYFGRRRYFPEIRSKIPYIKAAAVRMAVNAPIQGTSADIMKLAMVKMDKALTTAFGEDARMLLQVHDDVVLEVKKEKLAAVAKMVKEVMENVAEFPVPFTAKVSAGADWGDLKELE